MTKKSLVIGIGSILRRDDAIGPRIIEELEKEKLPEGVSLESGDVSGLDILKYFPGFKKAIIIDCADMKEAGGTIKVFNAKSIKKSDFNDKFSTHGIGLSETLTLAENLKIDCDITIIGIQPYDVSFNLGLSNKMEKKIPFIVKRVKEALNGALGSDKI